jgi:hypothetical protein
MVFAPKTACSGARLGRVLLAASAFVTAGSAAQTSTRSASEDQIRSAFLYQLAQYVEWPGPASKDAMRFCVLGQDDLAEMMGSALKDKAIQGRLITISKLVRADQLAGCHVAFVGLTRRKQLQELFERWEYPPVLLVGETDGFADSGGMVNLKIDAGRISIEINLNACRRAGLDVRSQLLRLARIVPEEGTRP